MMPVADEEAPTQVLTRKAPGHDQELADEAAGAGQADGGQHEQHEDRGVDRHPVHQPAVEGDLAGVHAVIDHADA